MNVNIAANRRATVRFFELVCTLADVSSGIHGLRDVKGSRGAMVKQVALALMSISRDADDVAGGLVGRP